MLCWNSSTHELRHEVARQAQLLRQHAPRLRYFDEGWFAEGQTLLLQQALEELGVARTLEFRNSPPWSYARETTEGLIIRI
jgi:alpha-L-fucosidase